MCVKQHGRYHDSIEEPQIEDLHCQPEVFCWLVSLRCFLWTIMVHPVMVGQWKNELIDRMPELFVRQQGRQRCSCKWRRKKSG